MKKLAFITFFTLLISCCTLASNVYAGEYSKKYTREQKTAICNSLQGQAQSNSGKSNSFGNGVIDDDVLRGIYNTTKKISDNISFVSILGDTLMCHATHAGENRVEIFGVELFSYPNIPIWLTGAIIYFFGFMMLLSICFYVVDISFKLGFSIILMPIGIALWPFDKTKSKLSILISIFLKSAAIFPFLAIGVAYTLGMLFHALGGLRDILIAITTNNTDFVAETFSLDAATFLLVVTSLAYGMKLIGVMVNDFANKFFPDKAFGKASPMHHLATQAMDFAKQKVVQPVASLAHDIAKTQAGRVTEKAGNLLQGKYHENVVGGIRNIGVAFRNPKATLQKAQLSIANAEAKAIGGVMKVKNNATYGLHIAAAGLVGGKQNRAEIRENLRNERDEKNRNISQTIAQNYKDARKDIDDKIAENEGDRQLRKENRRQQKQEEKQQKREERMANDPKYRARVERWQKVKGGIQNVGRQVKYIDQERQIATALMEDKIDRINDAKEKALINTDKFDASVNKVANTFANGGKLTNWYRNKVTGTFDKATNAVQDWQQKKKEDIDSGKLASNKDDGLLKAGIKHLRRDIRKAGINIVSGVAKAPTKLLSTITKAPTALRKGAVNAVAGITKVAAYAGASVPNAFIRGYYNIQKVPTRFKHGLYKAPDVLKGAWKVPGVILEKTGQTMQHNKPSKKDDDKE